MRSLEAFAIALIVFNAAPADDLPRAFEIADVHASEPASPWALSAMRDPTLSARRGQIRGGRYEIHSATLVDLISTAYSIDPDKLLGGPPWLDTARYDAVAKVPAGATAAALPAMLQTLLEGRFHLGTHRSTSSFPEFVLTARPRPLLKATQGGSDSGCKRAGTPGEPGIACRNVSMAQFAQTLPQIAADYFQGNKLIDQTQLIGAFDFALHWARRSKFATAGTGGITLANALETQLGLNLSVREVPEQVLVVDKADRTPTPNSPATEQLLPPVALAFEVAAIKPSLPGTQKNIRIKPSGNIDLQGMTLRSLIKWAWDIEDLDAIDNEELLSGAPRFSDSVRYDIVARAPATGPIDFDALKLMLRALLSERFGLTTHLETRTVSVLALIAPKPRLQPAKPRSRSGCRNAPMQPQSDMPSVPIFSVSCRNTTMAQLAQKLQALGGPYVPYPAIDSTGLTGGFDFTINWSPPHLVDNSNPSDPNGGISLVEALDKQLGVKLRRERGAMPVLVIDHLNPSPTPN